MYKKEVVYTYLKEIEQNNNLSKKQKDILKDILNFKKYLEKLQKYRYNITYGLDYLFNENDEKDYYEPIEIKSAFHGS